MLPLEEERIDLKGDSILLHLRLKLLAEPIGEESNGAFGFAESLKAWLPFIWNREEAIDLLV